MTPWWKWREIVWPWSELFRLREQIRRIPWDVRDTDLMMTNRSEANWWRAEWSKMHRELRGTHKGIARLKRKLKKRAPDETS